MNINTVHMTGNLTTGLPLGVYEFGIVAVLSTRAGLAIHQVQAQEGEHFRGGFQVDAFAFKNDAYLYLVDQAAGLTDEQRIELGLRGNAGLSPTTVLPPPA